MGPKEEPVKGESSPGPKQERSRRLANKLAAIVFNVTLFAANGVCAVLGFLSGNGYFNAFVASVSFLVFWSSLPLFFWYLHSGQQFVPKFDDLIDQWWFVGLGGVWLLLLITHTFFLARFLMNRPKASAGDKENEPAEQKGEPGSAPPPIPANPAKQQESQSAKTATDVNQAIAAQSPSPDKAGPQGPPASPAPALAENAVAQPPKPSPRVAALLERFGKVVQSLESVKLQFDASTPSRSLRGDLDTELAIRFALHRAEQPSAVLELSPEGALICKDVTRLRKVQPVRLEVEVRLAPSATEDFSAEELASLKPRLLLLRVTAHLDAAEERFLEWTALVSKKSRLPNVKQGQECDIPLLLAIGADPSVVSVQSLEVGDSGLTWNSETGRLCGMAKVGNHVLALKVACAKLPKVTRDLSLLLTCTMDVELEWMRIQREQGDLPARIEDDEMRAQLGRAASLIANGEVGHPVVPVPLPDFGKPHRVRYARDFGPLAVRYASVRGRSHIKDGKFREDHAGVVSFGDRQALAVVVSDGAGSAMLSRRGSQIVVHMALAGMREIGLGILSEPALAEPERQESLQAKFTELVGQIRARIEFESEQIRTERPSFADKGMYATFLGCLVIPMDGHHLVLSYAVGDGAIAVGMASSGGAGLKSAPDHGESAGQTLFILSKGADDASKRLRVERLEGPFALLLMTDGVTDPLVAPEETALESRWDAMAAELLPLESGPSTEEEAVAEAPFPPLVEWLERYHKSHHDDRTIACVFHQLT